MNKPNQSFKNIVMILVDIVLVNLSYIIAYYLRFNFVIPNNELNIYKSDFIAITLIYIITFILFKLYRSLWSYASVDEFLFAIGACISADAISLVFSIFVHRQLPLTISILAGIFSIILVVGFRMAFRIYRNYALSLDKTYKDAVNRVMVIGAGSAGTILIKEMKRHKEMNYKPVAVIDDNKSKVGTIVSGVKVYGTRNEILSTASSKDIDTILIAIPSADNKNKKQILDICKQTGCTVKVVPGIYELIDGRVSLKKIRDVSMEELLGRDPIKLDMKGIREYIEDKVIMITGGGGSIGSELCRQIIRYSPKQVIILDNYENNAYELQQEFKRNGIKADCRYVIASVRDRKKLEIVFKKYKPQIVFHAAAHKHVPLMEENPAEAVKNNVFGTLNLAECADKYGVQRFVMISTDKAVNPTNIMGATKRICEMIIQSIDKKSETQFVAVRFGNVLGSHGSVVPLFLKQIHNGGPVTVTHKEITRFFMTIPEAAQLVLQAGTYAKGGEIFILDMEKPVRIYDLACDLIKLSGLTPNEDIKIEFIGLRPGEKLYEEVLTDEEGLSKTLHDKIFVGKPTFDDYDSLKKSIDEFIPMVENDDTEAIITKIEKIVPTYKRFVYEEVAASTEK